MSSNDVSVVLVHGAWAGGSSWAKVITPLAADGIKVVAAPLPLTSFRDDVAALDRPLERVTGPIVLVGHAYAGAVIAAPRDENVKALVYVAALAPDEGETVADVFYRTEPHPKAPKLAPDNHGLIYLPESAFAAAFAQNASAEELTVLAAVQRPISPACITVAVGRPLWKDRPTWFLVAEQDRMIVRENQLFMAERMKAYLARPGAADVQLDLFGDYKSNVALYPTFQQNFRTHRPPLLAIWGKNDPFFLPGGAEAFRRDIPHAQVTLLDAGHFALETHAQEIAAAIKSLLAGVLRGSVHPKKRDLS